jgi:hypothetical protein
MPDILSKGRGSTEPVLLRRVSKVLVAVIALASLSLAFRAARGVVDRPLSEDAFYCYSISYHLAHGEGPTIDGSTLSNGFHPLFVFLCTPLFALAGQDKVLAVRLVLLFEWVLYVGTALLLGLVVRDFATPAEPRRSSAAWGAAALYLSAGLLFLQHFNGLETGCLLFLYAAAWRYYQASFRDSLRRDCVLGVLLGLVVLARIDAVFFVLILCLKRLWKGGKLRLREGVAHTLAVSFFSFLVSSPWWVYNLVAFHSLMPSSGKAEQAWALSPMRLRVMAVALGRALEPWFYLTESHWDWTAGWLFRSLLLLAGLAMAIRFRARLAHFLARFTGADEQCRRTMEFAGCLAASVLALAVWYALSSWATHFYTRYLTPLSLVAVFLLAVAAVEAIRKAPAWASVGAGVLLAVPILAGTAILWLEPGWFGGNVQLRQQLTLVTESVPPQAAVAAGQSGTLGYFRSGVVNLDGKVNAEALAYQSRMWEYLAQGRARWLCDWPSYVRTYLGDRPEQHGWKLVGRNGEFVLYHREPLAAGSTPRRLSSY